MKSNGKRSSTIGMLIGMGLVVTTLILAARHLMPNKEFGILFSTGYIIYLFSCAALAKAKGYKAAQGILVGIIFPVVLILIMPDRTKSSTEQRDAEDRENAAEEQAEMAAKRRSLKGRQKVFAWLVGLFFITVGLGIMAGYEIYWARVVVPERNSMATAILINADKLDPQNDGKLVYVTGPLAGCEKLSDPEFGVTVDALCLRRRVWMWQWKQGNLQGKSSYSIVDADTQKETTLLKTTTYNYTPVWSEKVISSRSFRNSGHDNPEQKGIPDLVAAATGISLGSFHIAPELVAQLDNFQPVTISPANLATLTAPLKSKARLMAGEIFFGADPAKPAIGDLKVKIEYAPVATVSVIAKQNGNSLSPFAVGQSGSIAQLRVGIYSAAEMSSQFSKTEFYRRVLVWVFGGFAILIGGIIVMVARRR